MLISIPDRKFRFGTVNIRQHMLAVMLLQIQFESSEIVQDLGLSEQVGLIPVGPVSLGLRACAARKNANLKVGATTEVISRSFFDPIST